MDEDEIRPKKLIEGQKEFLLLDIAMLQSRKKDFVRVNCPACSSKKSEKKFEKNGFEYEECKNCETLFMNPRPSLAVLEWFYENSKNYAYWNKYIFPASAETRRQKIFAPIVDRLLEIVRKNRINPGRRGKEARQSAQLGVYSALLSVLKTMAPIMPYITEEIYQLHFAKAENCQSIHISEWPKFDPKLINEKAEVIGDLGVDLINAVRKFKSENKMSMKDGLSEIVILGKEKELKPILEDLKAVCKAKEIKFSGPADSETELFKIKVGIKK